MVAYAELDDQDQAEAGDERSRVITLGQALAHDAGADDDREQQRRAHRLGGEASGQRH